VFGIFNKKLAKYIIFNVRDEYLERILVVKKLIKSQYFRELNALICETQLSLN